MRVESSTESDVAPSFPHRAALQERVSLRPDPLTGKHASRMARSSSSRSSHDDEPCDELDQLDEEDEELDDEENDVEEERRRQERRTACYVEGGRLAPKSDLEVELATKQREVSHLIDEMGRLQSSINNLKEMSTTKISQLEDLVNEKDRIIKELMEKLFRQNDYNDLKRELKLHKTLGRGGWQPWCSSEPAGSPKADHKSDLVDSQRDSSPVAESASPCSATQEDAGSVPPTPPSESSSQPRSPTSSTETIGSPVTIQRLHRCLRSNVNRFSGECLDTMGISRCVRELLSAHNIGQRMFAKLVLGLSQGTVSELLSKPKPWDKLTEKGRDSYRKMHAWACDQHCVHLLKSLLPRKGRESSVVRMEPTTTEERSNHHPTGSDPDTNVNGSQGLQPPDVDNKLLSNNNSGTEEDGAEDYSKTRSPHENESQNHTLHNHFRMAQAHPYHHSGHASLSKQQQSLPCGSEFPPVMLAHLYQEELLKLISKRLKGGFAEDHAKQVHEDVRQALSVYHRDLVMLAQQGILGRTPRVVTSTSSPVGSSSPCHACVTSRRPNCAMPYCTTDHPQQPCCRGDRASMGPYSVISPYSGTSPLVPLPSEGAQAPGTEAETSPLQRMQSITNSLLSQTSSPNFSTLPQRPSKAVLPPITQQQFDQYNNLNTEDIVKRVKEQLSQYSISQRLFGENVLGLSQGSVSDLLARPKPWHMLTQKGREPFIRMKMFLEDESAVHKLVASQYKIAPERLMRIGGYGAPNGPPPPGLSPHGQPRFGSICSEVMFGAQQHHQQTLRASSDGQPAPQKGDNTSVPTPSPKAPPSPTGDDVAPRDVARNPCLPTNPLPPMGGTTPKIPVPGRRGAGHHARCLPCVQPSVYEMAAVTTDLDTHFVTARIKETLTVHNIGQKLFGEAVLGLSQGSVSELLSKPKPWHMLSIKGREPFIRMQLWLNDPGNVEKLQAIKSERREANKRRRSSMDPEIHHPIGHADKTPPLPPYPLDLPPVFLYPPAKKPRILFSEEQKEALRLAYTLDPYPSTAVMEFLSNELGLSVRTITNWFHNHRMRLKQQQPESSIEADGIEFSRPPGVEPSTFDPIRFRMLLGQRLGEMYTHQQHQQQLMPASEIPMLPYFAEPLRLCSAPNYSEIIRNPDTSSLDKNADTLDLSMSSVKFPQRPRDPSESRSSESVHSTTSGETEETKPRSLTLSTNDTKTKPASVDMPEALCNMVTSTANNPSSSSGSNSGSNRRKAAAPQWVNPGLDLSHDSDLCSFDEDDDLVDYDELAKWKDDNADGNNNNTRSTKQIINGVCVRQTDLIAAEEPKSLESEVVHVVPAPAGDELSKIEREKNIQRIERALVEQEEDWDFTDSDADDDGDQTFQNTVQSR